MVHAMVRGVMEACVLHDVPAQMRCNGASLAACRVIIGTGAGTVEVFNASTGAAANPAHLSL